MQDMTVSDGGLQVIAAGLSRTGTFSLKAALETIYGKPCYHGYELIEKHKEHMQMWSEIDDLVSAGAQVERSQFERILGGYCCTTDIPSAPLYLQLMKAYPEAKVILTIRNARSWVQSVHNSIAPKEASRFTKVIGHLITYFILGFSGANFIKKWFRRAFESDVNMDDEEAMALAFERYNLKVQKSVPPHRLLVFQVKEGWEPLCKFLDVPVPDQPFPHLNTTSEINEKFKYLDTMFVIVKVSLGVFVGFTVFRMIKLW